MAAARPGPWAAFVALGAAAAAGLHHAHERRGFDGQPLGIIHRDVSLTNILVSYEGAVKLVDFGIAKASTSRHNTRPSVRKGKMAYMSPEQCRGDALDRRSDVFALGVVLYELATLSRAFDGEGEFAVMNQIVNHDLPPPSSRRPDVPPAIDRLILRAVSRDPQARPATARELQRGLEAFAVEAGLTATPEALAVMMEDLFGASPYPWETTDAGPGAVDDPSASTPTAATRMVSPVRVETAATTLRPVPAASASASGPARRPASWWLGGVLAAAAASLAWAFSERDAADAPSVEIEPEPMPAAVESPAAAVAPATTPTRPNTTPMTTPAAPSSPIAAAPIASAPAVDPVPATSTPSRPERRPSTKSPRPQSGPHSPTPSTAPSATPSPGPSSAPAALPAPFDPDAPAPRVR